MEQVCEGKKSVFGCKNFSLGPNHTLPTGGTARSFSGLSVHSFLKKQTFLEIHPSQIDVGGAEVMIADAVEMGLMEGLHGHSRAAKLRLDKPKGAPEVNPEKVIGSVKLKLALPKGRMQGSQLSFSVCFV